MSSTSTLDKKFHELELEYAKAQSQVDHLKSQNEVLELTLDDAKTTNEKFSINLARHESNATALQLALAYADQVRQFRKFLREIKNVRNHSVEIWEFFYHSDFT